MSTHPARRLAALVCAATLGLSGCSQLGLGDMFGSGDPGDSGDYATASIGAGAPEVQTGVAAWDGDVSAPGMTAAHATMAPGSWARVTNAATGASAVVQVNRRLTPGRGRDIELSRDAAAQIGALQDGLATVLIEPIDPRQAAPSERLWAPVNQPAPVEQAADTPPRAPAGSVAYDPNLSTASIPRRDARAAAPARGLMGADALGARYLQIGSYRDAANAQRMLQRLRQQGMTSSAFGDGFVETAYVGGAVYHRVRVGPIESDQQAQRALRDAKALGHRQAQLLRP